MSHKIKDVSYFILEPELDGGVSLIFSKDTSTEQEDSPRYVLPADVARDLLNGLKTLDPGGPVEWP